MANLRNWTASEIAVQMPGARAVFAKHFGPDGLRTGGGARLKDLAKWKGVDVDVVVADLNAMAKDTGTFA
ncbi:MAG TPA: hypothetical protein VGK74_25910 [Symbiobacteriaceae bacterium]|jgi:iron-sulfur cluster repair protein YtfE (RIC family)